MKKVLGLSSLALASLLAVTGCSFNKEGIYEFVKIEIKTPDGKGQTVFCTEEEKLDEDIRIGCQELYEDSYVEFKENNVLLVRLGVNENIYKYKIKDGVVLPDNEKKWDEAEIGKFGEDDLFALYASSGATIYYRKK